MQLNVLLELLNKNNVDHLIAGGYARDIHFGIVPKDIDIFVSSIQHAKSILDSIGAEYEEYESYCKVPENYIQGVIKLGDVDIVGISASAASPLQHVQQCFDYNINQFVILNDVPVFVGKDYGTLTCVRGGNPFKCGRTTYVEEKATTLGWKLLSREELDIFG